jgi:succinate-semialdehyde dehydrogenase/glutarate-semialdehyde dehydrogenase
MQHAYPAIEMYIDGAWTPGTQGDHEPVINPATGDTLGTVPHASNADLDAALSAAARGFEVWRDTPIEARTRILTTAARLVRESAAEIGTIMTLEQGKPLTEAQGEAMRSAGTLQWDLEEARRAYGRTIPVDSNTQLLVLHEPIGPVAAFTPWNFPSGAPMRKIAAALSAGCSIILKASEEVPGTACALVRCFEKAGLPPGVLNLVFGVPAAISAKLIASPITRLLAFTGSIPVGKHLAGLAAAQMKPAVMELGGHAAVIVCADADPVMAARSSAAGKFINAGQVCTSPSRFFVHESLVAAFTEAFVAAARAQVVGDGFDKKTTMGPLANPRRLAAAEQLVSDAVGRGAKVLCGGERLGGSGFFFAPTVLSEVPEEALIMQAEPFSPIAPIIAFAELDEAIRLANSLPYGLAGYAYTRSAATANRLMRRMEAGILSINHTSGSTIEAPSGGVKQSGYGREGGAESLNGYLVTKRVWHRF